MIPTALMGSTLPVLVAYMVRRSGNVGRSVGALYSANTFGSAASCFCAALFTMHYLGQSGSVRLAAGLNAIIGTAVMLFHWYTRPARMDANPVCPAHAPTEGSSWDDDGSVVPLGLALFLSGLAGFIGLGYEILWYRIYSFDSRGHAPAFALLLGFYLTGIALGSLAARSCCRRLDRNGLSHHLHLLAGWITFATLCAYLLIPLVARVAAIPVSSPGWLKIPSWYLSYLYSLPFVTVATTLLGGTFPLICHTAVRPTASAGARLGLIYLSNIIGSTLGSFVVGYVLMDCLTTRAIALLIALLGIGMAIAIFLFSGVRRSTGFIGAAAGLALSGVAVASSAPLFDRIYERLQLKADFVPGYRFQHVVENKSGVITVTPDGIVSGGGVYDGKFNTDVTHDTNWLSRPYSVSLWHPNPRRVLMIGLASGSWAQIVANHPQLEHMTVIEINPGYLRLIPQYPVVASLLNNPKVDIVIDDGRRWLIRNPGAAFDVIVMNTVYHWRAHSTYLLSTDFLRMARKHLRPGGVLFYNTTSSEEVQATGAAVFPHTLMVGNCIAVSDTPLDVSWDRLKRVLSAYEIDGRPSVDYRDSDVMGSFLQSMLPSPGRGESNAPDGGIGGRNPNKRLLTDDNMGLEWPSIGTSLSR